MDIGNRMKDNYENAYKIVLPKRLPLIIRLDGKSFHTLTRRLPKPWCENLCDVMDEVAIELGKQVDSVQTIYIQSDEISLLIHNYKTLQSEPWFDNELQKIVSVSAGIASAEFSIRSSKVWPELRPVVFDSRAWVMPENEVCNYFLWRQLDATRNAISMLARSKFSHKQCDKKSSKELQDILFTEHGINFNELEPYYKRGRCVIKQVDKNGRSKWVIDRNIPIFSENRSYIEDYLKVNY